jgi:hypothetical protein
LFFHHYNYTNCDRRHDHFSFGSFWPCYATSWSFQGSDQCSPWRWNWHTVLWCSLVQHQQRDNELSNSCTWRHVAFHRFIWHNSSFFNESLSSGHSHCDCKCLLERLRVRSTGTNDVLSYNFTMCCHGSLDCASFKSRKSCWLNLHS